MKPITYLACPYSHPSEAVRTARFEAVTKVAGRLIVAGHVVFSPITQNHHIAQTHDLPTGWDYWQHFDRSFIKCCKRLVVLRLAGWSTSVGVLAEIKIAQEFGLRLAFIDE